MKAQSPIRKLGDQLLTLVVWLNLGITYVLGLVIYFIYSLFAFFRVANIFLAMYTLVVIILPALGVRIKIEGFLFRIKGPYIFVVNHESFIDMFLSIYILVHLMGWRRGFSILFAEKLSGKSRFIPVIRAFLKECISIEEVSNKTREEKVAYLRNLYSRIFKIINEGKSILLFPEGERMLIEDRKVGIDMGPLKNGFARIASQSELDVVVVYIDGAMWYKPKSNLESKQWWYSVFFGREKKIINAYISKPIVSKGKTRKQIKKLVELQFQGFIEKNKQKAA
jgi:1-acyl-sn-glycerol-3-phosphate acyltransferase